MTSSLLPWLLSLLALSSWAQTAQTELPRVQIQAGMYQINAQVAATQEQRAIGLMNRADMPQHEGMVFVFEQAQVQCFLDEKHIDAFDCGFCGGRRQHRQSG